MGAQELVWQAVLFAVTAWATNYVAHKWIERRSDEVFVGYLVGAVCGGALYSALIYARGAYAAGGQI